MRLATGCAGTSVFIDRMTHSLSACAEVFFSSSLISNPLSPDGVKAKGDP
jgi:hypothetical protein